MADLTVIRNALATTIQNGTTPSLPCTGFIQSQVNPPMAYVRPQPGQLMTFDTLDQQPLEGAVTYRLIVQLIVAMTEDSSSQAQLDALLSTSEPGSVISAIANSPRLGNTPGVDFAIVQVVSGYGLRPIGDIQYLCSDVHVMVGAM
jgi:hypothetical protein